MTPRPAHCRRIAFSLSLAWLLTASGAGFAAAQAIHEPPALPVTIALLPSSDGVEASGFQDTDAIDVLLIRNGVTISTIAHATSVGGVLNVNGGPPSVCWAGVTPDMRPGDIVRFVSHLPSGAVRSIDQVHVMPVTATTPVVIQNDDPATPGGDGIVEIYGTASDLNGAPIPLANIQQRMISANLFDLNGRRTLRAGGGATDGTFTYDTVNNPTGINWTVRYSGLTAADVASVMGGDTRALWLGSIPANANELTIYENSAAVVPGPAAGTCTAPFEALDVTPPTAPTSLTSTAQSPSSRSFNWGPSTDNVAVAGYELRRDGVAVGRVGPLVTTFTDTGIPAGPHTFTVVAFDNASPLGAGGSPSARIAAGFGLPWGNRSAASNAAPFGPADTIPPTTPATLTVATGNGKAVPAWSAATDNIGVVGYGVYRNDVLIATVVSPTTTFTDSGLVTGTYNYSVDAVDAAGLRSARTANVAADVVFGSTTTPPTGPINEPPALPVVIAVLASADAIEASGFTDANTEDVLLIRNGVTISTIAGATSVGGVLDVNGAAPSACWAGVTPDIRPGDIVQYVTHLPDGTVSSIDQLHVMPITARPPVVVQNDDPATPLGEGIIEIHGTASDLNGQPIPVANLQQRMVISGRFALNGRKTLRAGGGATDGTFSYDTVNNPTGMNWTARYSGLTAGDVGLALGGETRAIWLGTIPANANELTIYQAGTAVVPGPLAGTCVAPLEPLDITPPTAPSTLTSAAVGPDSRSFSWGPSTDDVAVAGYELRRDGVTVGRLGPLATTFTDAGIPAGPHTYTAVAFDDASPLGAGGTPSAQIAAGLGQLWGNRSAASNAATFVQADVVPPTTPATLTVPTGNGKALPAWSPATDNVGVARYGVYRNDVLIATVVSPTTTYKDSGLVTGTYNYSVDAVDAAGLRSPRTANVSANVVFIPDTTPPTVPAGIAAVVTPDVHGRTAVVSWNVATDSMGVTGYTLYRNGTPRAVLGPATLGFRDSALATATYVYKVDAFDAANNHSARSAGATAVIANDPPLAPHALVAHPSRDGVSATGYPAAEGPYVFSVLRGATSFTSAPIAADRTGLVQVNAAAGCWLGTTPDLRAGDVVRITDAAGIAEQTTVADLTTQFALPTAAGTVVVHGTARDAAGHPLPLSQLEHRLVAATGSFEKTASAALSASAFGGADGSLTYDAPGSTHWTATYTGLSAADVARATGGPANGPAESRALWLGRTPATGSEQSMFETGTAVNGGPAAGTCFAPAESPVPAASLFPAAVDFGGVSAIPPATSTVLHVEVSNSGAAPMTIFAVYIAGFDASDYTITSPPPPSTLAPGGFFTVDVAFSPAALGARTALLCVSADAAGPTAITVPLAGTGITDTTPPTVPTGVAAAVSPDVHGRDAVVSWNAATDSVGVTGYTVYRDGVAIATTDPATLTYHDAGLAPATHVYRVDAFDLQNNHSAPSTGAAMVVASEPPAAGHVLAAHPTRDRVAASGYAPANGPYRVSVFRGSKTFTSAPTDADAAGQVDVNGASGGCWSGVTPDLRAGDVVRITDATGFAEQTTIADVAAEYAVAVDSATVVVHGTAQDAAGAPLPLDQLEHRLVTATGGFDKSGGATLRASAAGGADGTLAYDAPGSTHWTATYGGLSAADVVRATGGADTPAGTFAAAESQGIWLGRAPLAGTERTDAETGPQVSGGPAGPRCGAPAESPAAIAGCVPASLQFGRQAVSPAPASAVGEILFRNTGSAPMLIRGLRMTGLNAADFSLVSSDAPAVLAPGATFLVGVVFSPSGLGKRQAALSLACDAANTPALSIPLSGLGWNGLVIADPGGPTPGIGLGARISPAPDSATGARTIPVRIGWSASRSPEVTRYDLQQSVNGGPFVDAAVQPGAALGVTLPLPLMPSGAPAMYRFRVRAAGGGEVSRWMAGNEFGLEPVDESNADRVVFSGVWPQSALPGAWGGGIRSAWSRIGAELRAGAPFATNGSIAWITTLGPNRGKVSIRVDDRDSVVVDLYSDTLRAATVGYVATNLAPGRAHRMVVHALAEANKLATGGQVDVDAFIVMSGVVRSAPVAVNRTPGGLVTGLPDAPATLSFSRIAPNPVRNRATLTFGLPRDGAVRLDVLDVQGRMVRQLVDGVLPAGEQRVTWDGRTGAAQTAQSGVYFAVLRFGEQTLVRRLIWMP